MGRSAPIIVIGAVFAGLSTLLILGSVLLLRRATRRRAASDARHELPSACVRWVSELELLAARRDVRNIQRQDDPIIHTANRMRVGSTDSSDRRDADTVTFTVDYLRPSPDSVSEIVVASAPLGRPVPGALFELGPHPSAQGISRLIGHALGSRPDVRLGGAWQLFTDEASHGAVLADPDMVPCILGLTPAGLRSRLPDGVQIDSVGPSSEALASALAGVSAVGPFRSQFSVHFFGDRCFVFGLRGRRGALERFAVIADHVGRSFR